MFASAEDGSRGADRLAAGGRGIDDDEDMRREPPDESLDLDHPVHGTGDPMRGRGVLMVEPDDLADERGRGLDLPVLAIMIVPSERHRLRPPP